MWILSRDPVRLMPGVFTLGEVSGDDRVDFEREAVAGLYRLVDGRIVSDHVEEEIGLGIATERGLVVVSGCSHPGIVSMVRRAMELSGSGVYAVVGGFHLMGAGEERIERTVRGLRELGVRRVYTGHCTGLRAEYMLQREFEGGFVKIHSGMTLTLPEGD